MSYIQNLYCNDTIKYWDKKLQGKWYKPLFVLTKKLEFKYNTRTKVISNSEELGLLKFNKMFNGINMDSKVAVVIPAFIRNKKDSIKLNRLINKLIIQAPYKILVIDNDSPYKYNELLFANYIHLSERKTLADVRNRGIEQALASGSDIIAFTDINALPSEDWIESIKAEFISKNCVHALSGKVRSLNNSWFDKYHDINGTLNGRRFKDNGLLLNGAMSNFSIVTKTLGDLRFDDNLSIGEDIDFCYNLIRKGLIFYYCDTMIVSYDYGYRALRLLNNHKRFKQQFQEFQEVEDKVLNKIPNYYSYFNNTIEISNL